MCPNRKRHCDEDPQNVENGRPDISVAVFINGPGHLTVYKCSHRMFNNGVDRADEYHKVLKLQR